MKEINYMKRGFISLCVFLLLALSGCQEEPLSEYILPVQSQQFLGKESYSDINDHESDSFDLDSKYASKVTVQDEYLILEANDSQIKNLIENNQKIMEEIIQEFDSISDNHSVEWSDDDASVIFNADYECFFPDDPRTALENISHILWINTILQTNRILMTHDCDAAVDVTFKNGDSGHMLSKGLFPYESFTVTQKDWELSENQDVLLSSNYEGYIDMKMTVQEIEEDKIIFTPEDKDSFYSNDESLCLCLDSVYADEVKIPYHIQEGDVFILRVDGTYALHEDGDDILDIAPAAMIPEKYYVK